MAAQRAQGLDGLALRLVSRDDVVGHSAVAAPRQDRIIVLLGNGGFDVELRQPLQLYGGIAEPQAVQVREGLYLLDVLHVEPALLDENGADGAAAVWRHVASLDGSVRSFAH